MENPDLLGALDSSGEIREFARTGKWSLVVDWCERKQKKGDKTDLLQTLKLTSSLLDPNRKHKVVKRGNAPPLEELSALLFRSPPPVEADVLLLLEAFAQSYDDHAAGQADSSKIAPKTSQENWGSREIAEKLGKVWERAAASAPSTNVQWMFRSWVCAKLRKGNYAEAKQGAMAYMKAYPKAKEPFFMFIISSYLVSRLPETPERDRKLCEMLAYKALATAATDSVDKNGQLVKSGGRALSSVDDLKLLLRIYIAQGKYAETLKILDDPQRGFGSDLGRRDWGLLSQGLNAQSQCKLWNEQMQSCMEILKHARPSKFKLEGSKSPYAFENRGDDWRVWDALVLATGSLAKTQPEVLAQTEQLISDYGQPRSRNASLAMLKLHSQGPFLDSSSKKLVKKCQKFFEDYSKKIACFQDLREHLPSLSQDHQKMLLMNTDRFVKGSRVDGSSSKAECIDRLVSEFNSLKVDYNLLISRCTNPKRMPDLLEFSILCLKVFNAYLDLDIDLPQVDRGAADDAAILAAMTCICMFRLGDKPALLRSILILEHLLAHSKHNYDALLILTRLYMFLGAGSLAAERYYRLNVKNIQHASISWILFSRFSTVHPRHMTLAIDGARGYIIDPWSELGEAVDWHRAASKLTDKSLARTITSQQWDTLIGLLETQGRLQNGYGRLILSLERKRIERLLSTGDDNAERHNSWLDISSTVTDNRDRSPYPNYEFAQQASFEEILPNASVATSINQDWLLRELNLAFSWDRTVKGHEWSAANLRHLQTFTKNCQNLHESDAGCSTPEAVSSLVVDMLYAEDLKAESEIVERLKTVQAKLQNLHQQLQGFTDGRTSKSMFCLCMGLVNDEGSVEVPLWSGLHTFFTIIDLIVFIERYNDQLLHHEGGGTSKNRSTLTEQEKSIQDHTNGLNKLCREVRERIVAFAQSWMDRLLNDRYDDRIFRAILNQGFSADDPENRNQNNHLEEMMDLLGRDAVKKTCHDLRESLVDAFQGLRQTAKPR